MYTSKKGIVCGVAVIIAVALGGIGLSYFNTNITGILLGLLAICLFLPIFLIPAQLKKVPAALLTKELGPALTKKLNQAGTYFELDFSDWRTRISFGLYILSAIFAFASIIIGFIAFAL